MFGEDHVVFKGTEGGGGQSSLTGHKGEGGGGYRNFFPMKGDH